MSALTELMADVHWPSLLAGVFLGVVILVLATLMSAARDYSDDHGEHYPN